MRKYFAWVFFVYGISGLAYHVHDVLKPSHGWEEFVSYNVSALVLALLFCGWWRWK